MTNLEPVPFQYARRTRTTPEGWRMPSVGTVTDFQRSQRLGEVATHHPALHVVAPHIPADAIQSGDTRALERRLRHAAEGEIAAGRPLVGLAAPQIGVSVRAFLANIGLDANLDADRSELTLMLNPELTVAADSSTMTTPEGCYSCGPLAGPVERPTDVYAQWFDLKGRRQEAQLRAYGSVILGHEHDHLNGRLFPDLILEQGGLIHWAQSEEFSSRYYGDMIRAGREWPVVCSIDQWQAMKRPDNSGGPVFRLADFEI